MSRTVAKAQRLNLLREELRLRPRTVVELARRHETSRRTIERDLATLAEQMGEELRKDTSHRWYIPNRTPGLNEVEALAVYSATRLLLHTGVGERHYRTALEKLAQQVPEPARATLLRSVDRLEPAPEDRVLDLVAQAWFQQRVLKVDYASAHSGTEGAAVHSPGVVSGNVIQAPIHIPVNVCGNTVNVIGALNPAFGNYCVNK